MPHRLIGMIYEAIDDAWQKFLVKFADAIRAAGAFSYDKKSGNPQVTGLVGIDEGWRKAYETHFATANPYYGYPFQLAKVNFERSPDHSGRSGPHRVL
jgi:hypothetical protein